MATALITHQSAVTINAPGDDTISISPLGDIPALMGANQIPMAKQCLPIYTHFNMTGSQWGQGIRKVLGGWVITTANSTCI